jgi:hypothetical protein
MANEASPVPGGVRDGGRDIVTIEAFSLDDTGAHVLLDSASVEVPTAGMSAYYAMKRSTIKFESTELVRFYNSLCRFAHASESLINSGRISRTT